MGHVAAAVAAAAAAVAAPAAGTAHEKMHADSKPNRKYKRRKIAVAAQRPRCTLQVSLS